MPITVAMQQTHKASIKTSNSESEVDIKYIHNLEDLNNFAKVGRLDQSLLRHMEITVTFAKQSETINTISNRYDIDPELLCLMQRCK